MGLEGNEGVDELAKKAAQGCKRKPDYDLCPISYVKRCIRSATIDVWNQRYVSGTTASITKMFLLDVKIAYSITRKIQVTSVKAQVMTGHGGFSEYLNRFGCKAHPVRVSHSLRGGVSTLNNSWALH